MRKSNVTELPVPGCAWRYVGVRSLTSADGFTVTPETVFWDDGRTFQVTRVLGCERVGISDPETVRYRVVVGRAHETWLWRCGNRWRVMVHDQRVGC